MDRNRSMAARILAGVAVLGAFTLVSAQQTGGPPVNNPPV
jgi:hypothetical protein